MNLPVEAIAEFQAIYRKLNGDVLTLAEAKIKAENFLQVMALLTKTTEVEINN